MRIDAVRVERIPLSQWKVGRDSGSVEAEQELFRDHPMVFVGREDSVELWKRLNLSPIGAELFSEEGTKKYSNLRPILAQGVTAILQPAGDNGIRGVVLPGYVEPNDKESLSQVAVDLGKQNMKIQARPRITVPSDDIAEKADRNWKVMYEFLVKMSDVPREAVKSAGVLAMLHQEEEVGGDIGILGRVLEKVHDRRLERLDREFGVETGNLRREFKKEWEGVGISGDSYQLISPEKARAVAAGLLMVSLPTPAVLQSTPAIHREIPSDAEQALKESPAFVVKEFATESSGPGRQKVSLAKQGLAVAIGEKLLEDTDLALDLINAFEDVDKIFNIPDTKDPRQIETAKELLGIDADIQEGMSEIVGMQIEKHLEAGGSQVDALVMMAAGYKNIIHTEEGWVHLYGGDQQEPMTSEEVLEDITGSSLVKKLFQGYADQNWVDPNPSGTGSGNEATLTAPAQIEGLLPIGDNFKSADGSSLEGNIVDMAGNLTAEELAEFEPAIKEAIAQSPYKTNLEGNLDNLEMFGTTLVDDLGNKQLIIGVFDLDAVGNVNPTVIHTKSGQAVQIPFFFFTESKGFLFSAPGEGNPSEAGRLLPVGYWEENGKSYYGFGYEQDSGNGEFKFQSTFALIESDPDTGTVTYNDPYSGKSYSWNENEQNEFFFKVSAKIVEPSFLPTATPPGEDVLAPEVATPVFSAMGQEEFVQIYGSGAEQNIAAIQEWVKSNWNLSDKDIVTLTGDNGYITINRFDEETGRRETKFYSLLTGEERFDTNVAENYANNNWASDPEWQPTPGSRVTVMGHVDGLTQADGTPFDIPISIGAIQSSDIKRIVPSQYMADALARGYLEAYKARYEMQTGTELTWDEYLQKLQQGQGAPTVPQPNEDALPNAYYKYTNDSQFNPLAGVGIVFVDTRNGYSNLPVKVAQGTTLKNYIDENGRLVIILNYIGMSISYHLAKGEANISNAGNITAEEIFATDMTTYPARLISSGSDFCMLEGSGPSRECMDIYFSDESDQFINEIKRLTVEARKQRTLTESLLKDFQHAIPPQR